MRKTASGDKYGVTPVVAVVLMVVLTLALAAILSNFLFEIDGQTSKKPVLTVETVQEDSQVTFTVTKSEQVDSIILESPDITKTLNTSAGSRKSFSIPSEVEEGDRILVIATTGGSEQVIKTYTVR